MGSKARIAKYILPIILKDRQEGQWYIEPFCGGCNTLDKVEGNRIGCDSNEYLIQAMITIIDGHTHLPKNNIEFTEKDYHSVKSDPAAWIYGFCGFAYSYSGKWWGGWCRDSLNKRDYVEEAYKNAIKQSERLQGVQFFHKSYDELALTRPCVIYCDPPYAGTTKYKDGAFDHEKFWQWCRDMTIQGHQVFISEYNAPKDFTCIWQMELNSSLTRNTGAKKSTEKLFIFNNI